MAFELFSKASRIRRHDTAPERRTVIIISQTVCAIKLMSYNIRWLIAMIRLAQTAVISAQPRH